MFPFLGGQLPHHHGLRHKRRDPCELLLLAPTLLQRPADGHSAERQPTAAGGDPFRGSQGWRRVAGVPSLAIVFHRHHSCAASRVQEQVQELSGEHVGVLFYINRKYFIKFLMIRKDNSTISRIFFCENRLLLMSIFGHRFLHPLNLYDLNEFYFFDFANN